jgi:hypothetical protein
MGSGFKVDVFLNGWESAEVRSLPVSDRAIWADVWLILLRADEPGILREPLEAIAAKVNAAPATLHLTIAALYRMAEAGALTGANKGKRCEAMKHRDRFGVEHVLIGSQEGPIWYLPGIVRAEHLRKKASECGHRGGGNPALKGSGTSKGAGVDTSKGAHDTYKGVEEKPHPERKNADSRDANTYIGVETGGGLLPSSALPPGSPPHTPPLIPPTQPPTQLPPGAGENAGPRKRKTPPAPPEMPAELAASHRFAAAWAGWVQHRRERSKPLTVPAIAMSFKRAIELGAERAAEAIEEATANGWQGWWFSEKHGNGRSNGRERRIKTAAERGEFPESGHNIPTTCFGGG